MFSETYPKVSKDPKGLRTELGSKNILAQILVMSFTSTVLILHKLENFSSPQFLIGRMELTAMPYSTGLI